MLLFISCLDDLQRGIVKKDHGGRQNDGIPSHGTTLHKLAKNRHLLLKDLVHAIK